MGRVVLLGEIRQQKPSSPKSIITTAPGAQQLQSGHQSSAHQVPSGVWGCIFGSGVTQPFPELQENGIKVSGCLFLPFFGPLQAAAPCH